MLESPLARAIAIAVCLCALAGLFVWFGALEPAPDRHHYPGGDEVVAEPDRYVGQDVDVNGAVIATDPVRIEVPTDYGTAELTVTGAPTVETGQHLRVFRSLADDSTIRAEETLVRDGWEFAYMYAVSAIAALWVLARAIRHWRFEPGAGIVPRERVPTSNAGASTGGETDG